MVIFPLAPDQTIAQMWSNGAQWGEMLTVKSEILEILYILTRRILLGNKHHSNGTV